MKFDNMTQRLLWAGVIVALVVVVTAKLFGASIVKRWDVHQAVGDICDGRNMGEARTTLEMVGDRQYVLDKLKEALAEDGSIRCKTGILQTLGDILKQPRVVRRALEADSLTTRRAACGLLYGVPEYRDQCAQIAMDWLADEGAEERYKAAQICGQLKLEKAKPLLIKALEKSPETQSDLMLLQQAVTALGDEAVPGLPERLLAMLKDPKIDPIVRGTVLQTLERMKGVPKDQLEAVALSILKDTTADSGFRSQAALTLGKLGTATAWDALEAVLLDESEQKKNFVLQRNCLQALAKTAPLERVRKLILDRRVYAHPYFGIRTDVCTALAALNVREGIALDILTEYLLDYQEDAREQMYNVPAQAWLSLWVLTGTAYRTEAHPENELYRRPPPPLEDPEKARAFLFSMAWLRPGITQEQAAKADELARDRQAMSRVRDTYAAHKQDFIRRWAEQAAEKEKKADGQPPEAQGPVAPGGDQGPPAPRKDDEKGEEKN